MKEEIVNINVRIEPMPETKVIEIIKRRPIFKIKLDFWWLALLSPLWWVRFLNYRKFANKIRRQFNDEIMVNARQLDRLSPFFENFKYLLCVEKNPI